MKAQCNWGNFIDPRIYRALELGNIEGVSTDEGVETKGTLLPWSRLPGLAEEISNFPKGAAVIVTSCLEVWTVEGWEAEQLRLAEEREIARKEHQERVAAEERVRLQQKVAAWLEFHRQYPDGILPEGWMPARVIALRGLSERSSGCGIHSRRDVIHIGIAGKLLCGYKPKFDCSAGGWYGSDDDLDAPSCKGCLAKADRLRKKTAPDEGAAPISYAIWKQTREGEYLLYGPREVIESRRGAVEVRLQNGSTQRLHLRWRSKPFKVKGQEYCFARPEEKRECEACDGWHHREEVRSIYASGTMHTGAYWRQGESTCSCGGKLAGKGVV